MPKTAIQRLNYLKLIKKTKIQSAREAAFFALMKWWKESLFLSDTFQSIRELGLIQISELQLAQEVAFGVVRRFYTLDAILKNVLKDQKVKWKAEARLLLQMAVYQLLFMDKVPVYAVVFESVEISKQYCPYQAKFINLVLRKMTSALPINDFKSSLKEETYYSLSKNYIDQLRKDYGEEATRRLLESSIQRPVMTCLVLEKDPLFQMQKPIYSGNFFTYYQLKRGQSAQKIFHSSKVYIQNPTPGILMEFLIESDFKPDTVLDLCAAPGGKLLLLHRLFPKARLFANELLKARMERLKQNITKYQIQAELSLEDGTCFSFSLPKDLILIDAPCSNSGVLHKKPEARFRIEENTLQELKNMQLQLLLSARKGLTEKGQIWYMTCSVLKEENEKVIEAFLESCPDMKLKREKTILPDLEGLDGGYAALLVKTGSS